jgi:hypothetical protein
MRDVCDRAQERMEIDLAQAIEVQKVRASALKPVLPAGFCRNPKCCEEFASGDKRLFCGPKCASVFERFNR